MSSDSGNFANDFAGDIGNFGDFVSDFATRQILNIFHTLTQIPHGSGNTGKMKVFIESFAKRYGYEIKNDRSGNILASLAGFHVPLVGEIRGLKKVESKMDYKNQDSTCSKHSALPSYIGDSKSPGKSNDFMESSPKICFQAHYDMVCVGAAAYGNIEIIKYKVGEQTWLKAKDSSLGADNGMGVAIMLYFISQGLDAEFLFTNDEEIGMIGAKNLELPIKSLLLLNLDSERVGEITTGCAGGFDVNFDARFCSVDSKADSEILNSKFYFYALESKNFSGGHSGIDIESGKNAILLSLEFLREILESSGLLDSEVLEPSEIKIISWEGGEKRNSIPVYSRIIFGCSKDLVGVEQDLRHENLMGGLQDLRHNQIKCDQTKSKNTESLETEGFSISRIDIDSEFLESKNSVDFKTLYRFITALKIGVLRKSRDVLSSRNLSNISLKNGELKLAFMGRANTKKLLDSNLSDLKSSLESIKSLQSRTLKITDINVEMSEYYAPWERDSNALDSNYTLSPASHTKGEKLISEVCLQDRNLSPKVCSQGEILTPAVCQKAESLSPIAHIDSKSLSPRSKSASEGLIDLQLKNSFAIHAESKLDSTITPKIVELHAGLECGILLTRFREMGLENIKALSIGPSINFPHSTRECVWVESVGVIVDVLQDFIAKYQNS